MLGSLRQEGSDGMGTSGGSKGGMTAGVLLASAVCLLALPSAVLAFSTGLEPSPLTGAGDTIDPLANDAASADLARPIPIRSLAKGRLYLFTPAKTPNRPDRSVTVAVRVDPWAAKGISVLGRKDPRIDLTINPVRIAPNAFNLGVARGYHNFSQALVPPVESRKAEMPDLSRFSIAPHAKDGDSRFSPRIVIDEKQAAGRAPRTFAGDRDDMVDVGGAYRVTRNLDVTAGVRYSEERDRLQPVTTDGRQDNQAVYVGTQFRF
jgi:hypothetical protein